MWIFPIGLILLSISNFLLGFWTGARWSYKNMNKLIEGQKAMIEHQKEIIRSMFKQTTELKKEIKEMDSNGKLGGTYSDTDRA